jgi:hypothetical protein
MRRAVFALTLLLACSGALAADTLVAQAPQSADSASAADKAADDTKLDLQKPEAETPLAAESWWQKIVREAPNCKSFSDGCRTCSLTVCSNIGIACQPKEWSCNDTNADPNPKAEPDAKSEPKP